MALEGSCLPVDSALALLWSADPQACCFIPTREPIEVSTLRFPVVDSSSSFSSSTTLQGMSAAAALSGDALGDDLYLEDDFLDDRPTVDEGFADDAEVDAPPALAAAKRRGKKRKRDDAEAAAGKKSRTSKEGRGDGAKDGAVDGKAKSKDGSKKKGKAKRSKTLPVRRLACSGLLRSSSACRRLPYRLTKTFPSGSTRPTCRASISAASKSALSPKCPTSSSTAFASRPRGWQT